MSRTSYNEIMMMSALY